MNGEDPVFFLKNNPLFQDLTEAQVSFLSSIVEIRIFPNGAFILIEGQEGNGLYLIAEGEVEILKKDPLSGKLHRVSILEKGEAVGEMALLDRSPRSASARSMGNVKLFFFPLAKLSLQAEQKAIYDQIILNLSRKLSERLRKMDELTAKSLQAELEGEKVRAEMGRFLFSLMIVLSAWIFLVGILHKLSIWAKSTSLISIPIILIIFLIGAIHVKRSYYPPRFYGLTLENWQRNLMEGIFFTIPILIFCTVAKWYLIENYRIDKSIFASYNLFHSSPVSTPFQIAVPYLYIIFTPLQEFLVRGAIQSSIFAALSTPRASFWAIILSNLLFSSFHNFISVYYALASFVAGIFWGWLYAHQRSLIGPIVSHALVGWWVIQALGVGKLLTPFQGSQ